ncbi:MAG: sulfur carrier protein ThiS [Succinivibrio sp.]|nr:sulfur carrier protein ThiS [Succinivibrio sp.]
MQLYYNQEKTIEARDNCTVSQLLEQLELKREGVAVAVNDRVVKKSEYDSFFLKDHDAVDVFNMVSGG